MDKYEMKLTMTITKNGADFAKTTQEYANMNYDAMQTVQGTVVKSLLALGDAQIGKGQ